MANIKIQTQQKHEISPYLYMQFMEPVGISDSSVDAAWNFLEGKWHDQVISTAKKLGPTMVRFGGIFASYYHWKEGVGPRKDRIPMYNYCWDGFYSNHVGTHEVVDFCRQVDAEPLIVVNMESDGVKKWMNPPGDTCRVGTAEEAAEWIDYCNNPENALRLSHGIETPYNIKYWQVGNETSYFRDGFTSDQTQEITRRFAEKMRKADPNIQILGWGDETRISSQPELKDKTWCRKMSQIDDVDIIAFHSGPKQYPENPVNGIKYKEDIEKTWNLFMEGYITLRDHIAQMRADCGNKKLAITECHYACPEAKNRSHALCTWAAGVAYARCHNELMRNSDVLVIGTLADFFGNIWKSNAMIIPTPLKRIDPYLMPVGAVMSLFRHHQGKYAVDVNYDGALDVVASKTGNKYFLHIANTDMVTPQTLKLDLGSTKIKEATMYYIDAKPEMEITVFNTDCFDSKEMKIEGDSVVLPAAAVAAIEITVE